MEPEIMEFAASIAASEPSAGDEAYAAFRARFRMHNYFLHPSGLLVIKLSRLKVPFWGLGKDIVDFLNGSVSYSVILLRSASQGWAFSKAEVNHSIQHKEWRLESTGQQYKIHEPPSAKMFFGPKGCLQKLGGGVVDA
ncbi:MAG: hypothetical protein ACYCOU_07905 [Sulfobacillus sp.]